MNEPFPNQDFLAWADQDLAAARLLHAIFNDKFDFFSAESWAEILARHFATPEIEDGTILTQIASLLAAHIAPCSGCGGSGPVSAANQTCYRCHIRQERRAWLRQEVSDLPPPTGWEGFRDRARLLTQGDPEQALEIYAEAIRLNPGETELYLERGQFLASEGDEEAALTDFSHLLALGAGTAELYCQIVDTLLDRHLKAPDISPYLERALALDPGNPATFFTKGKFLLKHAQNQVLPWAEETIARFPDQRWGYFLKAQACLSPKHFDQALHWARQALAADPGYANNHGLLAHIYRLQERFKEALEALSRQITLCPDWYWGNQHRKHLWYQLQLQKGELDKDAWSVYQDQQQLITFNLYAHPDIRPAVLALYDQQLETPQADSWLTFLLRGRLRETNGDLEDALSDYALSLELNPDFPRTWLHYGTCLTSLGQPGKALSFLNRFIQAEPYNETGFYQLSRCHQALEDPSAAREALQQALAIFPYHAPSHYALAMAPLPADPAQGLAHLQQFSSLVHTRLDKVHFVTAHRLHRELLKARTAAALCRRLQEDPAPIHHPQALAWILQDPVLSPLHPITEQTKKGKPDA